MKLVLHLEQALGLALLDARQRDAGHAGDGLLDDVGVDLRVDVAALLAPLLQDRFLLLAELADLVAQTRRALEVLLGDGLFLLDVEIGDALLELLEIGRMRHRVEPDAGARLVHDVDRLVREETPGDVSRGEVDRLAQRLVGVRDAVVRLVAVAQTLQDRDRLVLAGRLDQDLLEAALERAVLLDVLAVLVERRRADALQLAARQRGLQHVAGVDRALGAARADQRVQLVDEQDDVLGAAHLGHDRLDALLELAAVLRARHHHGEVEHDDALVAQDLRHLALDDALREPLDDRRLADARLADEDRVVLRAARQDLHDALDLVGAADDRVELVLAGELGEVAAERVERRRLRLGVGRGDRRRVGPPRSSLRVGAEQFEHLLADVLEAHLDVLEDLGGDALLLADQPEQQVLGADVVVAEVARLFVGELQHLFRARREGQLTHRDHRRAVRDELLHLLADLLEIDVQVGQDVGGDTAPFLDQAQEDVLGADVVMVEALRLLAREPHDLAGAIGKAVKHVDFSAGTPALLLSVTRQRRARSARATPWQHHRCSRTWHTGRENTGISKYIGRF